MTLPTSQLPSKSDLLYQAYLYASDLYSEYTGFCHYNYEDPSLSTMPLYENFLFALLLMERKQKELFLRAQNLLQRLFAFQKRGGFPVYIHTYPQADRGVSFRILAPMTKMIRDYGHLLDAKTKKALQRSYEALLKYCTKELDTNTVSSSHELVYQCSQSQVDLTRVQELLDGLDLPVLPTQLKSQVLVAISLLPTSSLVQSTLAQMVSLYHRGLKQPIHPRFFELTSSDKIHPNLFTLIEPIYHNQWIDPGLVHPLLQLPLVLDHLTALEKIPTPAYQGTYLDHHWQVTSTEKYAVMTIEKTKEISPRKIRGFYPFCMLFEDQGTPFSFVLQSTILSMKTSHQNNGVEFEIQLEKEYAPGDTVCAFFLENAPYLRCCQEGSPTTIFDPQEGIDLVLKENTITLTMECGFACNGHIGYGIRPSDTSATPQRMVYIRARNTVGPTVMRGSIQLTCAAKAALSSATAIA